MSTNRLFIYDPESKSAFPLARGYAASWAASEGNADLNVWFDNNTEYTGQLEGGHTRYQLKTEQDLPAGTDICWGIVDKP